LLGNDLLQVTGFAAKILHFISVCGTRRVASKAQLPCAACITRHPLRELVVEREILSIKLRRFVIFGNSLERFVGCLPGERQTFGNQPK
jgi:hypothetical protein